MKSIHKKLIIIGAFALILAGCSYTIPKAPTIFEDANNPVINERGERHLDLLNQNIAGLDAHIPTDSEKEKVVELEENGSIYYFAADGKRYIFPNQATYRSWYGAYAPERVMPLDEMEEIPLGGNVTAKPGSLISTPTDPKVYLVRPGGVIRAVDEDVLEAVLGDEFDSRVLEIENWYFTNYEYGAEIGAIKDYPVSNIIATIDEDKGFDE